MLKTLLDLFGSQTLSAMLLVVVTGYITSRNKQKEGEKLTQNEVEATRVTWVKMIAEDLAKQHTQIAELQKALKEEQDRNRELQNKVQHLEFNLNVTTVKLEALQAQVKRDGESF